MDILAVTTQAREGIETFFPLCKHYMLIVTTQAREGIETPVLVRFWFCHIVTTQAREGIETVAPCVPAIEVNGNNSSP